MLHGYVTLPLGFSRLISTCNTSQALCYNLSVVFAVDRHPTKPLRPAGQARSGSYSPSACTRPDRGVVQPGSVLRLGARRRPVNLNVQLSFKVPRQASSFPGLSVRESDDAGSGGASVRVRLRSRHLRPVARQAIPPARLPGCHQRPTHRARCSACKIPDQVDPGPVTSPTKLGQFANRRSLPDRPEPGGPGPASVGDRTSPPSTTSAAVVMVVRARLIRQPRLPGLGQQWWAAGAVHVRRARPAAARGIRQ